MECRFDHAYFDGIGCQHLDHVEAEGDVGHFKESKPVQSSPADELLFFPIDRIKRTAHLLASSGFNLGEDKRVMVTADKIDLSPARRPEIPAEDFPSLPFEMTCGDTLSPCA